VTGAGRSPDDSECDCDESAKGTDEGSSDAVAAGGETADVQPSSDEVRPALERLGGDAGAVEAEDAGEELEAGSMGLRPCASRVGGVDVAQEMGSATDGAVDDSDGGGLEVDGKPVGWVEWSASSEALDVDWGESWDEPDGEDGDDDMEAGT
jgi:hypothetical protein